MKGVVYLLLLVMLTLMEVQCQQTFPYVSFMGQTLANHSYVDISQVGNDGSGSNSVQCHTDLSTCCSMAQGSYRGDWYFPNGDRLPFTGGDGGSIVENREDMRVDLHCISGTEPTGIYRCNIATDAIHINGGRETVYVGLYTSGGGKHINL